MSTDPNPGEVVAVWYRQSAVIHSHSHRPQLSDLLEVQRGMRGVVFQQFEVFSSDRLETFRKVIEESPETSGGAMQL
ncbi:MAG: hypothetical protein WCA34_10300 [Candidatus Acidiferrales bacterium]